jgi:OOP family OmpA-OmpF porin
MNRRIFGFFSICGILCILFLSALASAQPFLISGKINCYETKGILNARVSFEKQPDASMTFLSLTNPEGYSVKITRPGIYMLKATFPGYLPEFHEFNLEHDSLRSRQDYNYDFFLVPITLDQILPFRNLLFDVSSAEIAQIAMPELQRLRDILVENPSIKIRLEGHTDMRSNSRKSLKLSKRRINAVKGFLVKNGIAEGRISLKAIGGGNPLFKHGSPDAHQANRRVEVRVISL